MIRYTIDYSPRAEKELRKIRDVRAAKALRAAIAGLQVDPRPVGVKKLAGPSDKWRVRVGDWRVIYVIEDRWLVVLVVAVGLRGEVYGRM